MRKILLSKVAFLLLFAVSATFSVFGQVTTSSISGIVTDEKGEGLPGATVIAIHEPSGTKYGTTTRVDGNFNIVNLRVGGPYKVTVSFVGYKNQDFQNISLKLAEPLILNVKLGSGDISLNEVVVTSSKNKLLSSDKLGAVTNIGRNQILTLPSISRNINDLTRLTPQANGTSIGGGNYRQNNITVDGADFNNNFGIGTNLPGGSTTPISLDALEEISVNVTPYDVRQSGFIGSAINAVTRSGNNNISGSAYTYFRNDNMQGSKVGDASIIKQDLDYKQYGFRLGGPIIKNKLFYFVNAEIERQTTPGPAQVAATAELPFSQANPQVSRPTVTELETISKYLLDKYGYVTGPYQGYSSKSFSNKFLARLDYNLSQNHKVNVRYSFLESESSRIAPSTSTSPFTNVYPQNRQSTQALQYENSGYFQAANFKSLSAELNSSFGKVSNTLRLTHTNQNDPRTTRGSQFPFVDILKDGNPLTSFGTELFSYGNLRDVKLLSLVDNMSFSVGSHNLTIGAQVDFNKTKNGFQRFGTGYYVFKSWEDFTGGELPTHYGLTYPLNSDFSQVFPSFDFSQYSAYLQDEFNINSKLKLTGGLRLDYATYPSNQQDHPLIAALTFENGQKVNTGKLPDSRLLFSPRFGFNYDVKGDRTFQVRGGSGIFTGRVPFVWIVSQVGDAGMLQVTQTLQGANVPGPFKLDPYYPTTVPQAGTSIPTGGTTVISPTFKMPQTWKSSLAVDIQLPGGIVGSAEAIYNKDMNTAYFRNINLKDPAALNVTGYADNSRLIYAATVPNRFINPLTAAGQASATGTTAYNVTQLGNSNKGYYLSINAKLEKQFANGVSAMVAYVKNDAKNLFDGGGDQPASAWQGTATVNGSNYANLSYANYVVPNRIISSISLRKEYFKSLASSISLVYEGSSQGRYSYTYSTDFNRDGANADLIYVPKDASEITFVPLTIGSGATAVTYSPEQQSEAFFKYVDQDKYLSSRKGNYAERNGAVLPWRNQFDMKFLQDIFVSAGGKRNTLQLSLDVFNLGNLINSKYGLLKTINNSNILVPTNGAALVAGGSVKPTFRLAQDRGALIKDSYRDNVSLSSTYYMQLGLRYIFN